MGGFEERLRIIAVRLTRLRPTTGQQSTPLNFAVGAVFALMRAGLLGYPSQKRFLGRGQKMWEKARGLCLNMERGEALPLTGEWLAGFFFNDGIIRIDVAFEHLLRNSMKLYGHVEHRELLRQVRPLGFRKEWADSWKPVHREVNRLKHENRRFYDGPDVTYSQAINALDNLCFALAWGMKCKG